MISFCCAQALDEEGAARVHGLLQGRAFRSIGWSKLFDCLTIYEERFKKAIQSSSTAVLPDFPKPEAQALVAYLKILKKVSLLFILLIFLILMFWPFQTCILLSLQMFSFHN